MATISQQPKVELKVTFQITEAEARAIDGLVGYDFDGFVKAFYTQLGESYLKPHEAGLRTFFESIRNEMPAILDRTDKARKAFQA